ncbi:hypothetical protein [Actinoplanes sp. NPDC049118]|uniref:hypothetical protein n=1 Tax=Actinoplanes sp. NPDC049118 TaxID=3155769 RepID=UPI00340D9760
MSTSLSTPPVTGRPATPGAPAVAEPAATRSPRAPAGRRRRIGLRVLALVVLYLLLELTARATRNPTFIPSPAAVWDQLVQLKKTGMVLVTSRELATAGKPTLDLGVVSTAFATAHPDAVDAWRKAEAQALDLIASDPAAAATAVGKELNISAADAQAQLAQGVFLKPADLSSDEWLGTEAEVGKLAQNLVSAAEFLKAQQKIDAVPDLATVEKAIYVKGLPSALS